MQYMTFLDKGPYEEALTRNSEHSAALEYQRTIKTLSEEQNIMRFYGQFGRAETETTSRTEWTPPFAGSAGVKRHSVTGLQGE